MNRRSIRLRFGGSPFRLFGTENFLQQEVCAYGRIDRTVPDSLAVPQNMHRVHKAQHFLNAVCYYDNTRTPVRAAAEYAVQLGNFLRTKGGGWFV